MKYSFMELRTVQNLFLFLVLALASFSGSSRAHRFLIGGKDGWVLNSHVGYNDWAGMTRFIVNDTLVFKYEKGQDSVLLVRKDDYDGCNTTSPIKRWDDGATEINLDRTGPFFFISGNEEHCRKGLKVTIVVLSRSVRPPISLPPEAEPGPVSPSPTPKPPRLSPTPGAAGPVSPQPPAAHSPVWPPTPSPEPVQPISPSPWSAAPTPSMAPTTNPPISPSPAAVSPSSPTHSPAPANPPASSPASPIPSGNSPASSAPAPTPSSASTVKSPHGLWVPAVVTILLCASLILYA